MDNGKSLDILGVKPIADSINVVVKGGVDGASSFLSRICLPAAEEFGLLLRDKVSAWRAQNAVNIASKAKTLLDGKLKQVISAHPRIAYSIIENGSWAEDDFMQNFWAGLLASSCTKDGRDESNLIFINLLSLLTKHQAKLIMHICENASIYKSQAGFIYADQLSIEAEKLFNITDISDFHQLDRELDHLRSVELI
ncbi:MAG: hypothetical protein H7Z73_02305 [Candidatus Saccharibacteria bacterium]|nr:hypothetical protein [Moraxellaceae bacterium]